MEHSTKGSGGLSIYWYPQMKTRWLPGSYALAIVKLCCSQTQVIELSTEVTGGNLMACDILNARLSDMVPSDIKLYETRSNLANGRQSYGKVFQMLQRRIICYASLSEQFERAGPAIFESILTAFSTVTLM